MRRVIITGALLFVTLFCCTALPLILAVLFALASGNLVFVALFCCAALPLLLAVLFARLWRLLPTGADNMQTMGGAAGETPVAAMPLTKKIAAAGPDFTTATGVTQPDFSAGALCTRTSSEAAASNQIVSQETVAAHRDDRGSVDLPGLVAPRRQAR